MKSIQNNKENILDNKIFYRLGAYLKKELKQNE
jgi:hypothetical protein